MDLTELRQYIAADPDGLGLAGKTPEQITALINARTVPVMGYIGVKRRIGWATKNGIWSRLKAAESGPYADLSLGTQAILADASDLDVSDAETQAFLDLLVLAGIVTAAQKMELEQRATTETPRVNQLFGRPVQLWEVRAATQ